MFLIQQSSTFRTWTSRALMVHFRRALLFLVVSPRQNGSSNYSQLKYQWKQGLSSINQHELIQKRENRRKRIKINKLNNLLLADGASVELSKGLNNSMLQHIRNDESSVKCISLSSSITDQSSHIINILDKSDTEPSDMSTNTFPFKNSTRMDSNSLSSSHKSSWSYLDEQLFERDDDDDGDSYEKYQTSFSRMLHHTKSFRTIQEENKLESMLTLEPNTSIVTVRLLIDDSLNVYDSNCLQVSSNDVSVRLIAHRYDSAIQCDLKPIGCRKSSPTGSIQSNLVDNHGQ